MRSFTSLFLPLVIASLVRAAAILPEDHETRGVGLLSRDVTALSVDAPSKIDTPFAVDAQGHRGFLGQHSKTVSDLERVNNKKDPVPIVPGRGVGFTHDQGEVHIVDVGNAVACSENDNASDASCTIKTVPNIFKGNVLDHLGPYNDIMIGSIFCG
ncbi:hypothetical protein BDY19DRAFT_995826 [Irpex rosettiformis]|uniref:Uncharacterized protein n=1 Tax=Irpex rosettiformis TaxID=378272 RepID=A0ACB8TX29_9APHY|nr:hypothetical protein BDY19DRAFT_995826 [Irpex rosettiformis]